MSAQEQTIDLKARIKKYLCDEANRNSSLRVVDHKAICADIQDFIEQSGLTMLVIIETPDGACYSLNNRGMPPHRAIGMVETTRMEMQGHQVLFAFDRRQNANS